MASAAAAVAISAVAALAGGVMAAQGAESQASAQRNAQLYQAQVNENNASIAKQNAQLATQAGAAQAEQQELKTRAQVGAIRAAQGASNVDVNSGSALDTQQSQDVLGQLDALSIRSKAARQAYGYENQAASYEGEAGLNRSGAAYASQAGDIAATSSLLAGASSAAGSYANWRALSGPGGTPSTTGTGTAPPATFIGDSSYSSSPIG